jgi:hypothetical protein
MGRICNTYGGSEKFLKNSEEKPEGRRPIGRPEIR